MGPRSTPGGETKDPQAVTQSNAPPPTPKSGLPLVLSVSELKLKVMIQGPIGLVTK